MVNIPFWLLTYAYIKKSFSIYFFTWLDMGEGWDPINRFNPAAFYALVPSHDSSHCASCVFSPLLLLMFRCSERCLFMLLSHTWYVGTNCSLSSGVVFYRSLKTIRCPLVVVFISGRMVVSWMCSPISSLLLLLLRVYGDQCLEELATSL